MPRPPEPIKSRRGPRGYYLVSFAEAPGRSFSSPVENDEGHHKGAGSGRTEAIAWARRNRERLLAEDQKELRMRDFCRDFFAPAGAWATRMLQKGHRFGGKYLDTRQGHLDNYIIPLFGDLDPREIRGRYIDDQLLAAQRKGGRALAPATKYKIMYSLNLVLEDLLERRIIDSNPLAGIRQYSKAPIAPRSALPRNVLDKLFPASHGDLVRVWASGIGGPMWAALMLVLVDTGLRPGELRALKWSELYGEERAFVVRHGIEAGTLGTIKTTKNDTVKAPSISLRTAQELAIWRSSSRYHGEDDFIFTVDGINPIDGGSIVQAFRRGLTVIGVSESDAKQWTPYWLRHSFVTYSLSSLSEDEVALLAGHSVEVDRIYQHPDDEVALARSRAAREKLDEARGKEKAP